MIIKTPAKINFFLYITGKRPDGYHELISLMSTIGLYDILHFNFNCNNLQVTTNNPLIPENEENIAYTAASLFLKELKIKNGIHISIEKNIPSGAGLGGGSSNAACVLKTLNKYYNYPLTNQQLMSLGLSIGADVPFFIFNKSAIVSGIGEKCNYYNGKLPDYTVIIYPGIEISTKTIFKNFNLKLTNSKKQNICTLLNDSEYSIIKLLNNDLEQICFRLFPDVEKAKKMLIKFGAYKSLMTGSGASVYGLFNSMKEAQFAKREIQKTIINLKYNKWEVFDCPINPI